MKKNGTGKRSDAERACEWYAALNHGCVKTVRAVRSQFQRQDLFASDCLGKRADGSHVYLQVTAGAATAVSTRRRKLEAIPWHPLDTVELLQLVQTPNPANARQTLYFFRVHSYGLTLQGGRAWHTKEAAVPVPKEWFTKFKGEEE